MSKAILFTTTILSILIDGSTLASANPGIFSKSLSEQASDLIDKIPSFEIKLGSEGIAVSTGPSTHDIYYLVALIIGSLVIFILLLAFLAWCCCRRNDQGFYNQNTRVHTVNFMPNVNPLVIAGTRLDEVKVEVGIKPV